MRNEAAVAGQLKKKDLETLRKMPSPPPVVQRCLELVFIALHVEKLKGRIASLPPGKRMKVDWSEVQRMLANFQTFYPMMANFDVQASLMRQVSRNNSQRTLETGTQYQPIAYSCRS